MARQYKKSSRFYDRKYQQYLNAYEKENARMRKYGLPMAQKPVSRQTFEHVYDSYENSRSATQVKNKESVVKIIAKSQRYEYAFSAKQQARIRKYGTRTLEEAIELGNPNRSLLGQAGDFIARMYEDLRAQGLSGKDASGIISSDIFGSP